MATTRARPLRTLEPRPRFRRLDVPQCPWRLAVSTSGLSPRVDMRSHVMTVAALAAAEADDAARVDLPRSIRAPCEAQPVGGLQDQSTHTLAGVASDRAGDLRVCVSVCLWRRNP